MGKGHWRRKRLYAAAHIFNSLRVEVLLTPSLSSLAPLSLPQQLFTTPPAIMNASQNGLVNEQGEPMDLYIPRKWYVALEQFVWSASMHASAVDLCALASSGFLQQHFLQHLLSSSLTALSPCLQPPQLVDEPVDRGQ